MAETVDWPRPFAVCPRGCAVWCPECERRQREAYEDLRRRIDRQEGGDRNV